MHIVEYCAADWPKCSMPVEYDAYVYLKNKPLKSDIAYVAVPWFNLMNKNQVPTTPMFKVDGGFTICHHAGFKSIIPLLKKIGVDNYLPPTLLKRV